MPLLHDIILYIASHFPEGVGRTRLMKLLFLVDAIHSRLYGRTATGLKWVRWYYGPFSREVLDAIDDLYEEGLIDFAPSEVAVRIIADSPGPSAPSGTS